MFNQPSTFQFSFSQSITKTAAGFVPAELVLPGIYTSGLWVFQAPAADPNAPNNDYWRVDVLREPYVETYGLNLRTPNGLSLMPDLGFRENTVCVLGPYLFIGGFQVPGLYGNPGDQVNIAHPGGLRFRLHYQTSRTLPASLTISGNCILQP